jgi:hypothetical protein
LHNEKPSIRLQREERMEEEGRRKGGREEEVRREGGGGMEKNATELACTAEANRESEREQERAKRARSGEGWRGVSSARSSASKEGVSQGCAA